MNFEKGFSIYYEMIAKVNLYEMQLYSCLKSEYNKRIHIFPESSCLMSSNNKY